MKNSWEHFLTWAKANKLKLYFKISDSEFKPVPIEIWNNPFVANLIFGTNTQREFLVFSGLDPLTNLVITARDLELYLETRTELRTAAKPNIASTGKYNNLINGSVEFQFVDINKTNRQKSSNSKIYKEFKPVRDDITNIGAEKHTS